MKIYLDGEFVPKEAAKVSVFDHGLLYGDGVFEGIRIYHSRVLRLTDHIDRLYDSARAICLAIPLSKAGMTDAVLETIRVNGLSDGYVRLVVTRGVGTLGLNPYHCPKPGVIIIADSIALYPEEKYRDGLVLNTCATRRPTVGSLSPMVKSLNYLNNIMAKIEAIQAGADEGLMLNEQGYVAECTGDNIFVLKNGEVLTPTVASGALKGVTRAIAIEICKAMQLPLKETQLTCYDVYTADECFLTGTAAEIIPAVRLDGRPIGDGRPGPVTAEFIRHFREMVKHAGTPV